MNDLKSLTLRFLRALVPSRISSVAKRTSKAKAAEQALPVVETPSPKAPVTPVLQDQAAPVPLPGERASVAPEAAPSAKPVLVVAPLQPVPAAAPPPAAASLPVRKTFARTAPLVEGFFVARKSRPEEPLLTPLTEMRVRQQARARRESWGVQKSLGELPLDYGEDRVVALPLDPYTLFVFWDVKASTQKRLLEGLVNPRVVLTVLEASLPVHVFSFSLDSRSDYLRGLLPGRSYQVELAFVGEEGAVRPVAQSETVSLPPSAPSRDESVQFVRVLPSVRPSLSLTAPVPSLPVARHWEWQRTDLPGSAERTGPVPQEASNEGQPGGDNTLLPKPLHWEQVLRPQGSSEQRFWTPPSASGKGR